MLALWSLLNVGVAESLLFMEERSTAFEDVVASIDERWVVFGTGNTGQVHILSVDSWSVETMDVCSGSLGALAFDEAGYLYAGCDDTGVLQINLETGIVETEIPVEASSFYFASLYAGNLFVLGENPNGGNPRIHLVDLQQLSEQTEGNFPTTLGYGAPKDMERVGNYLVVAHGSTSISKVDPVSGGATRDQMGPTTGSCEDVLPAENASNALISGGTAGVYRFLYSSNQLQFASMGADLDLVTALVEHDGALWVADSTADSLKSFTYNAGGASMGSELLTEVPLDLNRSIQEMVSVQGYLIAGTEDGAVTVIGNGPWVEAEEPVPAVLEDETEFSVAFESTLSGTYELLLHGSSNDDGVVLASGSVNASESTVENLSVTAEFLEGDNNIRIVVSTDEGIGHDTVQISVDTPPSTPALTSRELGYGDEQIILSGTAISDSDVSFYRLYISNDAFVGTDFETDGPTWEQHAEADRQFAVEPNTEYQFVLTGLENDETYYVALRAFDEGGKFSPLSDVLEVTPKDTYSASQLVGETGGFCGLSTVLDAGSIGLSVALISMRRRRWGKVYRVC